MQRAGATFVLIAFSTIVFAGCLESDGDTKSVTGDAQRVSGRLAIQAEPDIVQRLIGHNGALQSLDPLSILATPPSVSYVSVGFNGPEPSIGATSNGMVFFQALARTMRSADGGATWEDISNPPFTAPTTLDPFLWVDPDTDRVFVDHLYVACSYLSFSDDFGETWLTNPVACGLPGNDHQKIGTGAFRSPLTATPAYENVVYYAYNGVALGSRVSMSFDGGLTWPVNAETVPPGECSGGLHGRLKAGPDGYAYVPKRACDGVVIAISDNNGLTWDRVRFGVDVGSAEFRKNPDVAIDAENNLYMVWPGKDNRLYLSVSRDHGATWSPQSILAAPPEITTTTMPSIVAGTAGRIAYAYYGVYKGNGEQPECVGTDEQWDVYVTWSVNALDENPSFVTTRANALDDPVQIGGISTNSGTPDADKNCKYRRNLLDFIDMAMDQDGRVYVATADGCIECENQTASAGSVGMASVQATGPSLIGTVADFLEAPKGNRS